MREIINDGDEASIRKFQARFQFKSYVRQADGYEASIRKFQARFQFKSYVRQASHKTE